MTKPTQWPESGELSIIEFPYAEDQIITYNLPKMNNIIIFSGCIQINGTVSSLKDSDEQIQQQVLCGKILFLF